MTRGVGMILRLFLVFLLVFVAYVANAFANPIPLRLRSESETLRLRSGSSTSSIDHKVQYGVSWSFEQAEWYGLDPRESYIELLDQFKFDWVRLPFFWDQMIGENGELRIESLEFAIEEAQRRNVKVIIALGLKTPYYPEFHLPKEIREQIKFGEVIGANHPIVDELLEIDKLLVQALAKYDNISRWQIENEPFLANIDNIKIDRSLIAREIEIVKANDPLKRPIILNHVAPASFDKRYKSLISMLKPGDVFGVNAYFKTQGVDLAAFSIFGKSVHIKWPKWLVMPVQSWPFLSADFLGLKKEIEAKDLEFWILEVQAEPYIRQLKDAISKDFFYKPHDIVKASQFVNSQGVKSIGLWGAHYWQYRQSLGDDSWVDAAKQIID